MELRIAAVSDLRPIFVAGGFITVGLALKAAIFPLHAWLPGAYTHSPHAATAFLAACSTKVALYVLFRFDFFIFQGNVPDHALHFRAFLLPLAVIAMIVGSAIAIYERDLKRLLAYSSIAHVGYIVFGAALATQAGLTGGIVHMFNHALAKGTLFLAVACIGLGGLAVSLERMAGAARRMPVTMAAFVVAGLSLIGIPGTAGFIGKWYLVLGAMELGPMGALVVVPLLASSVLAVVYVWRVVETAYFGSPGETAPAAPAGYAEAPPVMLAMLFVGAAANLWFGFQPELPISLAERAAETLLSQVHPHK
jgi:multicomponent Na+:H+ antiporter subunit D